MQLAVSSIFARCFRSSSRFGYRLEEGAKNSVRLVEHEQQRMPIVSLRDGYFQQIDYRQLIDSARSADALIEIPFRLGQFVLQGEPVAYVPPATAAGNLQTKIRCHVELGLGRVLYQDIEFGIARIVEIGIRALSPAINDTFTGIACVDLVGKSLTILARAGISHGRSYDEDG